MDFPRALLELHAAEHRAMKRRGISAYRPTIYDGPAWQKQFTRMRARQRRVASEGLDMRHQQMLGAVHGGMGMAGLGGAGDKLCGDAGQIIAGIIGAAGSMTGTLGAGGEGTSASRSKTASQTMTGVTSAWVDGCAARTAQQQTAPSTNGSGTQTMDQIFAAQQAQLNQLSQQNTQLQTAVLSSQSQPSGISTNQILVGGLVVVGVLGVAFLAFR